MQSFGVKCMRFFLFAFNLLFAVSGLAILIVGIVVQVTYSSYVDFLENRFLSAPLLLIIVGVITFFIVFLGCCGAIKENRCMLITFSVLLSGIFLCELGVGIAAYVLRNDVDQIVKNKMQNALENYGKSQNEGVTKTWDTVQQKLYCCGIYNAQDWKNSTTLIRKHAVPDSCCVVLSDHCGEGKIDVKDPTVIYQQGCLDALIHKIVRNADIIGGIGVGLALVQVLGILLACCFARALGQEYDAV